MTLARTSRLERSSTDARLRWVCAPRHPDRVVLLLHGQAGESRDRPRWHQGVVLRMAPFVWAVRRAGGRRVAVVSLRYAASGWLGGARMDDATWALQRVTARYPGVPVGLLGHSMGGRIALRLAGRPGVDRVVTLAAWAEYADVPHWTAGPGLSMWLVHGLDDRVTDPEATREAGRRFAALGADVETDLVPGETHAMLRQARRWHREVAAWLTRP